MRQNPSDYLKNAVARFSPIRLSDIWRARRSTEARLAVSQAWISAPAAGMSEVSGKAASEKITLAEESQRRRVQW